MQDMLFFMCLLIVFVVGYGVTYFAIMFPNESNPRALLSGIFSTTFLQMFGENLLEDIEGIKYYLAVVYSRSAPVLSTILRSKEIQ